jgi:hypothetical protein
MLNDIRKRLCTGIASVIIAGLVGHTAVAQTTGDQRGAEQKAAADTAKELEALKQRVAQLESLLKEQVKEKEKEKEAKAKQGKEEPAAEEVENAEAAAAPPAPVAAPAAAPANAERASAPASTDGSADTQAPAQTPPEAPAAPAAPPPVDLQTPFAFGDFTWMNAVPRNHDAVLDGKYFSGEFRVDTNYMYHFAKPIDHTLIGTTEGERTGELAVQALNVGGDFHAGNMQSRVLTQFGASPRPCRATMRATTSASGSWTMPIGT